MIRKIIFLFVFILLAPHGAGMALMSDADTASFAEANAFYREGNYEAAGRIYEELLERSPDEETLHFNLGNSYFRSGFLPQAILAYERAKHLNPRNGDIRKNLSYVKNALEYKIEDKRNWYLKAGDEILEYMTEKEILLTAFSVLFLLLSILVYSIFSQGSIRWGWFKKTLAVLCLLAGILVMLKDVQKHWVQGAIVMSREAEVRYGPSVNDQVAFRLGGGLKVYVIQKREDWSRVLLTNGEMGWIDNTQIELIRQ